MAAGRLAKWLARHWPALELDIVEFDPVVVRMAEEYFEYRPPANHHVFVKDGRAFLNATDHTYDVMWIDAFARDMIPFHLTTAEFYSLVRTRLNPEGIVAVNLASSGKEGDLARAAAVVQTMRQAFPVLTTFAVEGPWKTGMTPAKNLIFFGGRLIEHESDSSLRDEGHGHGDESAPADGNNRVVEYSSDRALATWRRLERRFCPL